VFMSQEMWCKIQFIQSDARELENFIDCQSIIWVDYSRVCRRRVKPSRHGVRLESSLRSDS
jgi:hypothetical protein